MKSLASILLVIALGCVSGPVPVATGPIDWRAADESWSLHIVTVDPDGDERVTRVWLAVEDGAGTVRTGDSRWRHNLERTPSCRIRLRGTDYPVRAQPVTEPAERARIDDAFARKYGWLENTLFRGDRGETHENYARLEADEAPGQPLADREDHIVERRIVHRCRNPTLRMRPDRRHPGYPRRLHPLDAPIQKRVELADTAI